MKEKNLLEQLNNPVQEAEKGVEKKESLGLRILVYGDQMMSKATKSVFDLFYKNVENVSRPEEIIEYLNKGNYDVLFINSDRHKFNDDIKSITEVRNSIEVKKQPVIITWSGEKYVAEKLVNSGADVGNSGVPMLDVLSHYDSVPEMLEKIEDEYGDKMLKNKQGFYKNYKDKLMERSELTADTEKELEILDEIFKENNVNKVLDAGGGSGRLALPLSSSGYDMTVVDSSRELIEELNANSGEVKSMEADLRKMPIKDKQFDAVSYNWHVFCDILGNKAKQAVLSEAKRVLKDDGTIVLDIPNRNIHEDVLEVIKKRKASVLNESPEEIRKKIAYLETEYEKLESISEGEDENEIKNARSVLLLSLNLLKSTVDEKLYLEPDDGKLKKSDTKLQQVDFKKDGIYLSGEGQTAFIGYVPSEKEMIQHLEKAGFEDIKTKKWKTKNGFYKLTFVAKKQLNHK